MADGVSMVVELQCCTTVWVYCDGGLVGVITPDLDCLRQTVSVPYQVGQVVVLMADEPYRLWSAVVEDESLGEYC